MTLFSSFDSAMMARALRLAEKGVYLARPNPRVGCVLTRDERVIGEGYHRVFGQAHAEIEALRQVDDSARGATAYVTLEPCAHQGKTGPCALALIEAGVTRVVCAMRDPNPRVDGGGFALLQDAGVQVDSGLMESEARALNPGFIKRMTQNLPRVTVKLAQSLDGRTAMASGESQWITGPAARLDVQRMRASSDAIMTGSGTFLADNPSLNVRSELWDKLDNQPDWDLFRQPLRVLIDRQGQANLAQKFFRIDSPIWWVTDSQKALTEQDLSHVTRLPWTEAVGIRGVLKQLADAQCNDVMVEAGSRLAGVLLQQGFVDELVIYQAAKIMGSTARPLVEWPMDKMEQAQPLKLLDCRHLGEDLRLRYQVGNESRSS
ncbi:bifunctional diaminohydroxyphosphoribosylaminopyrimidine deaminase/5-amino-6-(5-phosphoribosylamino)uracil reductase RibD [Pleionea litopenaei]|uniref:Riboflavin biosynthesis protein RibD n=1 Tax=Pleionea litopenaei TaxID=3070815 RepID=A0AA51RSG9_9GAMM|nr:bifunctional diaminohydroxyphosphoribosylaminopyrimidine deaminase/5-amino-6-(5-phosphoribosylamino)uracil reductase RibD [Pleionea sp. HL-JVS1]WMS86669.1 bifunctional diaminohydroxyphosphoribosylaminopyrimidine deaminase/5-amino-6-(5-phosphoribosylamino)uracil reductase RibD [Pleionea sp. HL-JVS1]